MRGGIPTLMSTSLPSLCVVATGKPSDHCPASKVVMSPDPAVVGKNVTFTVTCTSDETVSGGESQSNIYLYGIKVLSHTVDLCTLQKCPSPPGTHSVTGVRCAAPRLVVVVVVVLDPIKRC